MCRYQCEGARCQSGQGMIWYAYKDCPTGCRCLPRVAAPETSKSEASAVSSFSTSSLQPSESAQCSEPADNGQEPVCDSEVKLPNAPLSPNTKAKSPSKPLSARDQHPPKASEETADDDILEHGEVYVEPVPELEDAVSTVETLMDWIDDNGRFLFGGAVVLFLTCTILPTLIYVATGAGGGGSSHKGMGDSDAAKAKVAKENSQHEGAKPDVSSRKPSSKDD